MTKEQHDKLTSFIASAFTHFKKTMIYDNCNPPTPEQTKTAYQNDPTIHAFTDATVYGIVEIIKPAQENSKT